MMRFYRVVCKRGHCGRGKYLPISFVFAASDAVKAVDLARQMPGVKHTDHVLSCCEIPYAEYMEYRKISAYERLEEI